MNGTRLSLTLLTAAAVSCLGVIQASAETFTEWLDRYEIPASQRGFDDAPAGDGIGNLLKYALGLDPSLPSRDALPQPERIDGNLTLTVNKNPDATGIEYEIVASTGLAQWTSDGLNIVADDAETLVVEDTSDEARRFLQLRLTPPPDGPTPDAYLYVVGGRMKRDDDHENFDKDLDLVDTALPDIRQRDVRSILIADIDYETATLSNWRRNGTYLPTNHPVDDGILHWTYMHSAVHHHNGRIYVGPGQHNLSSAELESGDWSTANFITWAEVDPATGELSEFSNSEPFPAGEDDLENQRIGATVIAEVDGTSYFYLLGGSPGNTDRVIYSQIDDATGALGPWQTASQPLPGGTSWNAAISVREGQILHTGGVGRGGEYEIAILESGGDIANWQTPEYQFTLEGRFEHVLHRFDFDDTEYVHAVGGNSAAVLFDEIDTDGSPSRFDEFWESDALWAESEEPLPEVHRRASSASFRDMIVVTGGVEPGSSSYADTLYENNLWVGSVTPDGNVTWSGNAGVPIDEGDPLWAPRSFHGSIIVPAETGDE